MPDGSHFCEGSLESPAATPARPINVTLALNSFCPSSVMGGAAQQFAPTGPAHTPVKSRTGAGAGAGLAAPCLAAAPAPPWFACDHATEEKTPAERIMPAASPKSRIRIKQNLLRIARERILSALSL